MTFTPLGGLIGTGVPSLAVPAGATATAMGGILLGLVVLAALVIVVADRRRVA
jgi:hypothetical protein